MLTLREVSRQFKDIMEPFCFQTFVLGQESQLFDIMSGKMPVLGTPRSPDSKVKTLVLKGWITPETFQAVEQYLQATNELGPSSLFPNVETISLSFHFRDTDPQENSLPQLSHKVRSGQEVLDTKVRETVPFLRLLASTAKTLRVNIMPEIDSRVNLSDRSPTFPSIMEYCGALDDHYMFQTIIMHSLFSTPCLDCWDDWHSKEDHIVRIWTKSDLKQHNLEAEFGAWYWYKDLQVKETACTFVGVTGAEVEELARGSMMEALRNQDSSTDIDLYRATLTYIMTVETVQKADGEWEQMEVPAQLDTYSQREWDWTPGSAPPGTVFRRMLCEIPVEGGEVRIVHDVKL